MADAASWPRLDRSARVVLTTSPLLAVLVYVNALHNPFVFDDVRTVVENPSLGDLSNFLFVLVYERFRPLVNLSYAVDHRIWGLNPVGYHITSLALHALNVLLFTRVLRALPTNRQPADGAVGHVDAIPAAFAVALFACHPVLTEAVGYVSGRAEVLCATFFLGALRCFQRFLDRAPGERRWTWLLACLVLWLAATASKEVGALLPGVLLLYDLLLSPPEASRRRLLRLHLPLLALVAGGAVVRGLAYLEQEATSSALSISANALTQIEVLWRYVALLLLPVGQSLVHSVSEASSLLEPRIALGAIALGALGAGAWCVRRRCPLVALGCGWFVLLLLPVAALPLAEVMAEHRVYLASIGLFLVVAIAAGGATSWAARRSRRAGCIVAGLLVAVLLVLCAATLRRNEVWRDPLTLWRDAVDKAPDVAAPLYALADEHRRRGECQEAIPLYRRAIAPLPRYHAARNNLGICLADLGRLADAERTFLEITRLAPGFVDAHTNLGLLALSRGRLAEARTHFQRALAIEPQNARARARLAAIDRGDTPR